VKPKEIRLTGGGSKTAVWRQICADVFGVPTVCLKSSEGAALGAAVQALWAYEHANGRPSSSLSLSSASSSWTKKPAASPTRNRPPYTKSFWPARRI